MLGARLDPKIDAPADEYPFLPAVHGLPGFRPHPEVTFLVGENGSGKSTLVEAIAVASGFSHEGGPLGHELGRAPQDSVSGLGDVLLIDGGPNKPKAGFFLRAESFFNVASIIDGRDLVEIYGGRPMHAQSHGESFLALASNRFGPNGLFIFDEPEAALSVTSQLAFIALMHRSAAMGSQFIVATHSPILLGYPGAVVYEASEDGLERIEAGDADAVRLTRDFMLAPDRFLHYLFDDSDAAE
ncbi:MAG TPA: AAA family ATPase [Solirubrobacteraceae bacterium]|nr:AAA family ATPase [Solirubrobacteraceae bacterium]